MKKSIRLFITGSLQSIFFRQFIKENAEANDVKGFLRNLGEGKVEIFLEGQAEDVDAVATICRKGPKYAQIRSVEEKPEHLQDFKDFRILKF
ncbi:MAG: acylphosphatase [Nanoarchaeota archaeon]